MTFLNNSKKYLVGKTFQYLCLQNPASSTYYYERRGSLWLSFIMFCMLFALTESKLNIICVCVSTFDLEKMTKLANILPSMIQPFQLCYIWSTCKSLSKLAFSQEMKHVYFGCKSLERWTVPSQLTGSNLLKWVGKTSAIYLFELKVCVYIYIYM